MIYNYVKHNSSETITFVFMEGEAKPATITKSHPKWDSFLEQVQNGSLTSMSEDDVLAKLSPAVASHAWLTKLSDRVSASLYGVSVDGVEIDNKISQGIVKALGDDPDDLAYIRAMARFLEKASTNPSLPDANQLYDWILAEGLTLTSDGDFVGYKRVLNPLSRKTEPVDLDGNALNESDVLPKKYWISSRNGGGTVDGIQFLKYVPNYVGAVVEMPRDKVDPNGAISCSIGLHVGTFSYASRFETHQSGTLTLVKVNPRDVVSVPDYDFSKLRACRYTVISMDIEDKLDEHLYVDVVYAPASKEEEEEEVVAIDTSAMVQLIIERIQNSR